MALTLAETIGQSFIVAYKEDTKLLATTLAQEGLPCQVMQQEDRPEYQHYASSYRCLLNHSTVWQRAAESDYPTLIVEADFVPVKGIGKLPLPFSIEHKNIGICWLYSCAHQLFSVTEEGHGEGYSTSLVAYILTPDGAKAMLSFVDLMTHHYGTGYSTFDSEIYKFLYDQGFKNFIPFRNYGEHGGISNPEHRKNGLSGIHRADVLYGSLAFFPNYAESNYWIFLQARCRARIKGIGRLLLGRFLRPYVCWTSSYSWRLLSFAIRRQLTLLI